MADPKTIIQKIVLKTDEYSSNVRKASSDLKKGLTDMNKSLFDSSKQFLQSQTQIKLWGQTIKNEASAAAKEFGNSLALGAKAIALDTAREALHQASRDAITTAFSFSKAFAEIKSRSNASESDLMKWRNSIMQISTDTTANMDSMAESFKDMFSSVKNPDELLKIMGSIGAAAAMGDGDATKISSVVKKTLTEQGRKIDQASVDDVLGASDVLRRRGNGYKDEDQALGALGGIRGADVANSGMSMRSIANVMSAATQTSGSAIGGDVVKMLLSGNSNIDTRVKLQGALGLKANKSGQLDLSSLGSKEYSSKVMGLGGTDETRRLAITSITGASDDVAQAFLNIAKKGQEFQDSLKDAEKDTQTFAVSAERAKDNLENAYKGLKNSLVTGTTAIFGGFEGPLKNLMNGHLIDAAKQTPSAIGQGIRGVVDHPMLALGALAATAGVGKLLSSVMPGGLGKTAALAGEVGIGNALKQAGVTPVYVVNAQDIGKDGATMNAMKGLMGGTVEGAAGATAGAGGLGKLAGFAAKYGKLAKWGGAATTVGMQAYETYGEYGAAKNDEEKSMALKKGAAGAAGGIGGMYAGAAAGAAIGSVVPVVGTAIGGLIGAGIGAYAGQQVAQKVVVEIQSRDPGLRALPQANDNARDTRNH